MKQNIFIVISTTVTSATVLIFSITLQPDDNYIVVPTA